MIHLIKLSIATCLITLLCTPVFAGDVEISGGKWVEKSYAIKGGWKIVNRDESRFIVFDDKFKTKNGPDLKVYLSRKSIDDVEGKSVAQSSIKISPLQSNKGAQEYEIPSDINLDDYSSVLIHCEAYSHLWGGGALDQ